MNIHQFWRERTPTGLIQFVRDSVNWTLIFDQCKTPCARWIFSQMVEFGTVANLPDQQGAAAVVVVAAAAEFIATAGRFLKG